VILTDVDNRDKYDGWFTLEFPPHACTCDPTPWTHPHYDHKIMVFPTKFDDILECAINLAKMNIKSKVVKYEKSMGSAIDCKDVPNDGVHR
jgi:hypothetical protein